VKLINGTLSTVGERLIVPAFAVAAFVGGIWTQSMTAAREDSLLKARVTAVEKELDRRAPIFDLVATIDNRQHENRAIIDGQGADITDLKTSVRDLVMALGETNKKIDRLAEILIDRHRVTGDP
jgi:hypothetical protein